MKAHHGQKAERIKKHDRERARNQHETSSKKCVYCRKVFTLNRIKTDDHIIPSSRGGSNRAENIIDCCWKCNNLKNNDLPHEFKERIEKYISQVHSGNTADADKRFLKCNMRYLQEILVNLELVIKRVDVMKHLMLAEGLSEPLLRRVHDVKKPGVAGFSLPETKEYKKANQEAIEAIAKEMPQNNPQPKTESMPDQADTQLPSFPMKPDDTPKFSVGDKVFRPYENFGQYFIHETIVHKRIVYDEVLVGLDTKDGPYEIQGMATRIVEYYVKGCDYAVNEEELYSTEGAAKFHIQEKYFAITVKIP